MERKIKLYDKNDVIYKIKDALNKMEELGLDAWTSPDDDNLGLCIEILKSDYRLGISDYILHIFFFTSNEDLHGNHVFDTSVSTKYDYSDWINEVSRKFDTEAGI